MLCHEILARKLPPRLARYARYFLAAQFCFDVDALLLAAICDRESLGGMALNPPNDPAGVGDSGHGRGLMQLDDRAQSGLLIARDDEGKPLWKIPAFAVLFGAWVLACRLRSLKGDQEAALAAYNAGLTRVRKTLAAMDPEATPLERSNALNKLTTGGDYCADVLARRDIYVKTYPEEKLP